MKKKCNLLLTLILLISINSYSQSIWDKVKKGVKEAGKQIINNNLTSEKTFVSVANSYYYISYTPSETDEYCGKKYFMNMTNDTNINGNSFFSFYDGPNCLESSEQKILEKNIYSFVYILQPNGEIYIIKNILSTNKSIIDVTKSFIYCERYNLIDNNIYLTEFKDKKDLETNKSRQGHLLNKIENGNILNDKGETTAKYSGNNNQEIMMILTSLNYKVYAKLADVLKNYNRDLQDKSRMDSNNEYLTLKKHCNYCNKEYSGVSFDMALYHGKNNGCDKVDEVYHDASCSRKCAFDYCRNQ